MDSSNAMEFEGFKRCMEYLIGYGLLLTTFISDRHTTITCHMKKVLTNIVHYFDIWHLKKSKYFFNIPTVSTKCRESLYSNSIFSRITGCIIYLSIYFILFLLQRLGRFLQNCQKKRGLKPSKNGSNHVSDTYIGVQHLLSMVLVL